MVAPVPPLPTASVPEIFAALKTALNSPFPSMLRLDPTFTPPRAEGLAVGKAKAAGVGIVKVVPTSVAAPDPLVDKVRGAW